IEMYPVYDWPELVRTTGASALWAPTATLPKSTGFVSMTSSPALSAVPIRFTGGAATAPARIASVAGFDPGCPAGRNSTSTVQLAPGRSGTPAQAPTGVAQRAARRTDDCRTT